MSNVDHQGEQGVTTCLSAAQLGLSQLILILSLKFTLQSADV